MSPGEDGTTYVLDNAWVEAHRRLTLLEECFDPLTARGLDAIGVEPGWDCLEIGGGAGSVTRSLCARVGPSGRVTVVDLDTRFLDGLPEANLEVQRRDIVTDGLPGGPYDLIHTRLLLIHLPARDRLVEQLAASLRPGGWLLLEEMDEFPILQTAEGLYRDVMGKLVTAFDHAGVSTSWARGLPRLCQRVGLEDLEPVCDVRLFPGGSTYAELFRVSLRQMRPLLLAAGATGDQLDELAHVLTDPTRWFPGWAMVSVRGRTPGPPAR